MLEQQTASAHLAWLERILSIGKHRGNGPVVNPPGILNHSSKEIMHNESKLRVSKAVGPALRGSRLVQLFDNDTLSSCKFTPEKHSIQLQNIYIY